MTDEENPVSDPASEASASSTPEPIVGASPASVQESIVESAHEASVATTPEPPVEVTPTEENRATESTAVAPAPTSTQEQRSASPQEPAPPVPQSDAIKNLRNEALEKRRAGVRERHDGIMALAHERGKKGISNNDVQLRFRVGDTTAAEDLKQLAVEGRLARNGPKGHERYEAA